MTGRSGYRALEAELMLAGLVELNVGITFLRQAQVDHAGSDVSEVIAAIKRQLAFRSYA
ncbi:hypothetical protein ACNKHT_28805 [Shigella flexneri]